MKFFQTSQVSSSTAQRALLCFSAICALLALAAIAPGLALAGTPSPYLSVIEVSNSSAQAVDAITPYSDGIEFLLVLVSEDDSPISGSIYAASSRARTTDYFFFQDAGDAWIAVGPDGEIPLAAVAANSLTHTPGSLERVLSFHVKVVSIASGNPFFAFGLHGDCTEAFAKGTAFPPACDPSHIIMQTAFGGPKETESTNDTAPETQLLPDYNQFEQWYADGATSYPLRVRIMIEGIAVSGVEVLFALTRGEGATLSPDKVITDSQGLAEVNIKAVNAGSYTIEAKVSDRNEAFQEMTVSFIKVRPKLLFTIDSPFYTVDGERHNALAPAFLSGGRTFLSVRDMGNAIGAQIEWDPLSQSATLWTNETVARVTVGSDQIHVNQGGSSYALPIDAPAVNQDGRVYLPFRAVLEAFGFIVDYNEAKQEISCT